MDGMVSAPGDHRPLAYLGVMDDFPDAVDLFGLELKGGDVQGLDKVTETC